MARQIGNEDKLVELLRTLPQVIVDLVDFSTLSFPAQIALVAEYELHLFCVHRGMIF